MAAFTGVAAEFSPLIVDETYARSTAFGGQVVPGSMIAALAIGLGSLDVPAPATAGMVGMSWRFLKAVRPGDSIEANYRLNRKRAVENPAVGLCFWQIEVLNQHRDVVATGEVGRLVQRRHLHGRAVEADGERPERPERPESGESGEATARRRRRRGGRGGAEREPRAAPAIAEAPEPAPADAPSAGRRRRRRGGRGGNGAGAASTGPASPSETAPPPAPVETTPQPSGRAAPSAETRGIRGVFRRLRGGGAES